MNYKIEEKEKKNTSSTADKSAYAVNSKRVVGLVGFLSWLLIVGW